MMKDFNWNEFKEGKVVVHCPKRYLDKHFFSKCIENGIDKWKSGDSLTSKDYWNDDKDATCYYVNYGFVHSHINGLKEKGYKIIEWKLEPVSKEEIKEIAKFISREEFAKEFEPKGYFSNVFSELDVYYCGTRLNDIKFKGDKEEVYGRIVGMIEGPSTKAEYEKYKKIVRV